MTDTPKPICISPCRIPNSFGTYQWVFDQFGRQASWLETKGWRYNCGEYFFYDEKDAVMFLMRWGGEIL